MFCFSVAYCKAILFLRTGRSLFGEYFFLEFSVLFMLVDLYIIFFNFVSAVPVGALDRVAELLNRIWWQR